MKWKRKGKKSRAKKSRGEGGEKKVSAFQEVSKIKATFSLSPPPFPELISLFLFKFAGSFWPIKIGLNDKESRLSCNDFSRGVGAFVVYTSPRGFCCMARKRRRPTLEIADVETRI